AAPTPSWPRRVASTVWNAMPSLRRSPTPVRGSSGGSQDSSALEKTGSQDSPANIEESTEEDSGKEAAPTSNTGQFLGVSSPTSPAGEGEETPSNKDA
ncbi:unnamed protein product, partial [Amoebophrya sp. A25]